MSEFVQSGEDADEEEALLVQLAEQRRGGSLPVSWAGRGLSELVQSGEDADEEVLLVQFAISVTLGPSMIREASIGRSDH